jgi:ABC-2 type transport system ATP-binding protein
MPQTPAITVENVRRSFRSTKKKEGLTGFKGAFSLLVKPEQTVHEALKPVSFTIEPGAFVGLIGANGAGKTTLLKILSGLIQPTEGRATVLGMTPFERTMDFRKTIALVMGQKAQLWWDLPASDAFDLLRAIYEIPHAVYRERLGTLTELLDVQKLLSTQIRRLSLGERMKMELIGAILHWPKVIFLDEPTIGLDVFAAHKLREFLRIFNQKEKATIILTSHNMDDIEKLCPRVLILKTGELVYDGAPGKLTRQGERRLRVRLTTTVTPQEIATAAQVSAESVEILTESEEEPKPIYITCPKDDIVPILQKLMSKFQVIDMGIEEQSLEAVIQRLFQGATL